MAGTKEIYQLYSDRSCETLAVFTEEKAAQECAKAMNEKLGTDQFIVDTVLINPDTQAVIDRHYNRWIMEDIHTW